METTARGMRENLDRPKAIEMRTRTAYLNATVDGVAINVIIAEVFVW